MRLAVCCLLALFISKTSSLCAQNSVFRVNLQPFGDDAHHWYDIKDEHNIINPLPGRPRYSPDQAAAIGDNILLYQKQNGGWPKNYDIAAILTPAQKDSLLSAKTATNTTFDNGSTYTQVEALSQIYAHVADEKYKTAALKGLQFMLAAQYGNGGWPQYYPLEKGYSRNITFNDGAYCGIMRVLKDIVDGKPEYRFIDAPFRKKIKTAFDKGLDCILKTQIKDGGKLTAWCQQHDEVTLQPAWARKFEPPSISNGESADVVLFLMSIDHPSSAITNAVESAVHWFEDSKILHTRVKDVEAPKADFTFHSTTKDKVVVTDPAAPPIWTRYYELGTHRPLFCNRDSKVVYSLAEVERERRTGYAWYVYAPQKVLDAYPKWKKRNNAGRGSEKM